jgi:anti-anti-sigma factor
MLSVGVNGIELAAPGTGPLPEAALRALPAEFGLKVLEAGKRVLARVTGPLDQASAPQLLARLEPLCTASRRVVLDLRRADFLDSSGVRALLQLRSALQANSGELRLVIHPEGGIARTLKLLRLDDQFTTHSSSVEAWLRRTDGAKNGVVE